MNIKIGKKPKYEPKHVQTDAAVPKAEIKVRPTARTAESAAAPSPVPVRTAPERERVAVRARPSQARMIYDYVLGFVKDAHAQNQHRIRVGMILLFLLPLIVIALVLLTDSNRIAFLIIWIFAMFALATFMIYAAYDDHELKKVLSELEEYVPESWGDELDGLLPVTEEEGLAVRITPEMVRRWLAQRRDRDLSLDAGDADGDEVSVRVPKSLLVHLIRREEKETADEEHMANYQN